MDLATVLSDRFQFASVALANFGFQIDFSLRLCAFA